MYLEILRFKIYIENCAKNKCEEQKEMEGVCYNPKYIVLYHKYMFL